MAVDVRIAKLLSTTVVTRKVEILGDNDFRVTYRVGGTDTVVRLTLSSYTDSERLVARDVNEGVLSEFDYVSGGDNYVAFVIWGPTGFVREDRIIDRSVNSYPFYAYLADGVSATPGTETVTWTPPALTYLQKQARAIAAIEQWRDQKRVWMSQAAERADLASNLVEKVGTWLKAADAAIQKDFQDPTVDPLTVEALAIEASKGALDITDVDAFMRGVYYNASTPSNAQLWVKKTSDGVERVNFADAVDYGANSLRSNYDPIRKDWIVANQPGKVSLDDTTPVQGTAITATVSDPDGGIDLPAWHWESRTGNSGMWSIINGSENASYTPAATDVGKQLRAVVYYNDNAGTENTAASDATTAVVSS